MKKSSMAVGDSGPAGPSAFLYAGSTCCTRAEVRPRHRLSAAAEVTGLGLADGRSPLACEDGRRASSDRRSSAQPAYVMPAP